MNTDNPSLHKSRIGKEFWYGAANGGFENWTGVPIEVLGCVECHGPTDASGNPYPQPYPGMDCGDCHRMPDFVVEQSQCLSCHGRQRTESGPLGFSDVHRDAGMLCWDCHTSGDLHGDGTEYMSMLEPSAIDVDCEDCHGPGGMPLPAEHPSYDPHGGALHCKACHTQSVVSCYNCHFESQVEAHVKRAKQPLGGFVMLVNREEDGKVHPATFQSLSYEGSAFTAFAPYTAHTITGAGRMCSECHLNPVTGSNEAIAEYNATGKIRFAEWDDTTNVLSWVHGIVPITEDYQSTLKMDFITYDGDPSDPPGPSMNWSSIGKDTWDGSQLFFASPLTRDQMDALGFARIMTLDLKPGACTNPLPVNSNGVFPAALAGTADLDVSQIDVSSLMLEGVPVFRTGLGDVCSPPLGDEDCACPEGPDGYMDLTLKFKARALAEALAPFVHGEERVLTLTGQLMDGTPIVASDCVIIRAKNVTWMPPMSAGPGLSSK